MEHVIYYCKCHNTTIQSNEYDNNGNKKRQKKYNSRNFYNKEEKEYYLDTDHSDFCKNKIKKYYINMADINEEINNYKEFRKQLITFLDKYPIIKYKNFKKKVNKLYIKNKCVF